MHPLDPKQLVAGTRLTKGLFSREGVRLLSRGAVISEAMANILARMPHTQLFAADSLEELAQILSAQSNELPAPAGSNTEAALPPVAGSIRAPIDALPQDPLEARALREHRRVRARRMKFAEQIVAEREPIWERLTYHMERGVDPIELAETEAANWPDGDRLSEYRAGRVRVCGKVLARIVGGLRTSVSEPIALVDELIEKIKKYPERFTQLALLQPRTPDRLAEHAYATMVLSIAIAARLQWSENDTRLAGLTGLLVDVGMALLPRELRSSVRPLSELDTNRVFRHPVQGVVLLDSIDDLPEIVRLAVYQHHERENGAGYPAGTRGSAICDLAKVVAVADAFAAATEPRPYRPRKRPYDALEEIIQLGSQGMYARRVVRALVESTGLFPVGSFVKLNTGQIAQVIGAHADSIDRPMVRVVHRGKGPAREPSAQFDLASHLPWELHVIQAADEPANWAA